MEERDSLQETIRKGNAPAIIKRRASRGTLPVSSDEMLDILVFLTKDADPTCSQSAQQTLETWTTDKWLPMLDRTDVHPDTLTYFAAHPDLPEEHILKLAKHPQTGDLTLAALTKRLTMPQIYELLPDREHAIELPEFTRAVLGRNDVPSDFRRTLESALPKEAAGGGTGPAKKKDTDRMSVTQKLQQMTVADKIAYAPKAEREAILIMIREPVKMVYRAALSSPKFGDPEAESVSALKNVSDEVLRALGTDRKWLKNKVVVRNLVNNPRTPIDVALTIMKLLHKNELKAVTSNRNVAEVVRRTAQKMIKAAGG